MKQLLFTLALSSLAWTAFSADRVELVKNLARRGENPGGKLVLATDGKYYGTTKNGGTNGFGCVYRFDATTGAIATVASFGSTVGRFPEGELLDGADGFLYGTAKQGGAILPTDDPNTAADEREGLGTIFRVKISDGTLTKLAQFDGANSGKFPLGGLVKVGSRFYGVASEGGESNCGTVFKVTPVAGSTNWDLGAFAPFTGTANGKTPWGTLVDVGNGSLLGTTEFGGSAADKGCVFKVGTSGASEGVIQLMRIFAGGATDGANPRAGLWKSKADGFFYGTTYAGGTEDAGTVFRINSAGAGFAIVASMESAKGSRPQASVVEPPVPDDFLYGTCSAGGTNGAGTVFKVIRNGNGATINPGNVASCNDADGKTPLSGLIFGNDGLAYGTAEQGGTGGTGGIFRITTSVALRGAASFLSTEGSNPRASLAAGPDGTLYGTTFDGGATGFGSVFRVTTDGTFETVANFVGTDGANPLGQLIVMPDGTLYGTTYKGGTNGRGTFFRITADGTVQSLVSFGSAAALIGSNPRGTLIRNGNDFFGVTEKGGESEKGTIFKITVNSLGSTTPAALTTLVELSDGEAPFGGLVDGGDGFYYGATTRGGTNNVGTFFKVSPSGELTKLYDFTLANPVPGSNLVIDSANAAFYGTTDPTLVEPPVGTEFGTVYKITTTGTLTTLHSFTGDTTVLGDGRGPRNIARIGTNLLAGVTYGGGGSLFTIGTSPGAPTKIYSFSDNFSGVLRASRPEAAPFLAPDGAIYGVTQKSSLGGGAIYRMLNSPEAIIISVTETAPNSAIARGIVNPNGETVDTFFEFATNVNFNSPIATSHQSLSGIAAQNVSADLSPLTPGTTYFVRLRAGTRTSPTFTYGPPLATTGAAAAVGASVATFRSIVNPYGRETSVTLQYGNTLSYASQATLPSAGNGSAPAVIEAVIANLTPSTNYHYRIVATNAAGTTYGTDATFSTGINTAPSAPALLGLTTSLKDTITIALPTGLDPDGDTLTLDIENQPSFGTASIFAGSAIRFTPNAGFKGTDTLTYSLTDPSQAKTIGTVTIRNPFTALKGNYLTYLTDPQGQPTGTLKLTLSATGAFTGTLTYGGTFPLQGTIDPVTGNRTGTSTITVPRKGKPDLSITLHFDTSSETGTLSGTVDGQDITPDARLITTAIASRHTVWLRPPTDPLLPQGNGWATLTISAKGAAKMAGKLSDGTPFATAPSLRATDSLLINVPLYTTQPITGRGYLFGPLTFADKPGSDADGTLQWRRGPQPTSLYYPLGFGPENITVLSSRWVPPTAIPGTHQLDLTDGGLADNEPNNLPLTFTFLNTGKALITSANIPEKVTLVAAFKTGTFTGTFIHPDVAPVKPRAFSGILFQKQNTGIGLFLGTTTAGAALIDLQ